MRVLFFAQLQDVTGCPTAELAIAEPLTFEQLWSALIEIFPALQAYRSNVRLACNWEYAGPETFFNDEDEVALIPPVSGG
jgi:molybdopterin converting factor subunit 1